MADSESKSKSDGDIGSVDGSSLDPRVLAALVGKPIGLSNDSINFLVWVDNAPQFAYSFDDSSASNYTGKPIYGGWEVHDTASSAQKNLADAIDQTVQQLGSSLNTLMDKWQGAPVPHLKSSVETFIESVQTLAHSVRTSSEIHSRQSQFFSDLYSWGPSDVWGLNFYREPGKGKDVGGSRYLNSAYEANELHSIYAGGQWYNWLNPGKWVVAVAARIKWNNLAGGAHQGYKLYVGFSAGNAAPHSFGSVPQIPKLTNASGGGGAGGGGGGTGGGGGGSGNTGQLVNQLAALAPSMLMAPLSAMGMLSGLAGGAGQGGAGGNTLAATSVPDAPQDGSASDSRPSAVIGTRVPDSSRLPSAAGGFRFPPGWDSSRPETPPTATEVADRASAERSADTENPTGGGMPGMMPPPMMGNRGGTENSSSRPGGQKETAPIFFVDKAEPLSDDDWTGIITNLVGSGSNEEPSSHEVDPFLQNVDRYIQRG